MCRCGLTSSTAPEGLADSTAKYNVLETWTMTARKILSYYHEKILPYKHAHMHVQVNTRGAVPSFTDKVASLQADSKRVKLRGFSVSAATT